MGVCVYLVKFFMCLTTDVLQEHRRCGLRHCQRRLAIPRRQSRWDVLKHCAPWLLLSTRVLLGDLRRCQRLYFHVASFWHWVSMKLKFVWRDYLSVLCVLFILKLWFQCDGCIGLILYWCTFSFLVLLSFFLLFTMLFMDTMVQWWLKKGWCQASG